jgi:hypothetical protein
VKQFLTVLTALMLFGLMACEGPAGPAGAEGPAGKDGLNGADGKDGLNAGFVYFEGYKDSLKCATCHTADTDVSYDVAARKFQWATSKHALGGAAFEGSRNSCAECHASEGYVEKQTGQTVTAHTNQSPIGCFACHSPHMKGDFSLRTVAPVTLVSNVTGVADFTFDYGKGNLCASCHHPRSQSTVLDISKLGATDSFTIPTSRWDAHHSVQSAVLAGKGGVEIPGYTYSNSFHTSSPTIKTEGCVICHMADAVGNYSGGHTMILDSEEEGENTAGCTTSGCHDASGFKLDYNGVQTEMIANMDTLKTLLISEGLLNGTTGLAVSGKKTLARKAAGLWNYKLIENDLSEGVHNTKYTRSLLRASIAELRK